MKALLRLLDTIDIKCPNVVYTDPSTRLLSRKEIGDLFYAAEDICLNQSLCRFIEIDSGITLEFTGRAREDYMSLDRITDAAVFSNYFEGLVLLDMSKTEICDEEYVFEYLYTLQNLTKDAVLIILSPDNICTNIINRVFENRPAAARDPTDDASARKNRCIFRKQGI